MCGIVGYAGLGGYEHFMLKEIHEQPEALENVLRGRLSDAEASAHFDGLNLTGRQLRRAGRLLLTGCGSSYHAALVGKLLFESMARVPAEVEYASEFRYRDAPIDRGTVVLALSQSGETADTLAAVRESKRKGHPTIALFNVAGSSIARAADGGVYLRAGPEAGGAGVKAFTAQALTLAMLALHLGRLRHLSALDGARALDELRAVPEMMRRALACEDAVRGAAERYADAAGFLFLGRQLLHPVALEGALKLKEVTSLPAEGYPAGELRHGPIARAGARTPSVFLIPNGPARGKTLSDLEAVKARGGPVLAVATLGDEEVTARADEVFYVPDVPAYLQPLVAAVPLQLLAYYVALKRGCEVDRPRDLATSATAE
jgi:glucosamine--fructose-6-phosphate aminotransferase (isomerizing)